MTDLSRKSSRPESPKDEGYSVKKGTGYGAFGGFIAIVAFTGVMLWMPISEGLPTGTFIAALGSSVAGMITDAVLRGVIGFGLVVAQGVIVGIIFGVVTSKISTLYPSGKKRGISFGLATGIIAFVILYVPFVSTITSNFTKQAPADTYTMGVHTDNNNNATNLIYYPSSSTSANIPITFGFGLFAYLLYGFLLGGIVTLAYSVYHFDLKRIHEHNYNAEQ
jgi:hypothetical protein